MKKLFITVMFLIAVPGISQADIYKFQDEDGRIYYAEKPKTQSFTRIIKTGKAEEQPIKKTHKQKSPESAPDKVPVTPVEEKKPDNRTPIEQYHDSHALVMICRLIYKQALITGKKSDFEKFTNCLSANKVAIKEKLTKALETINNSKAQEALKNYHVALMSALSSIIAGSDERTTNYEQRQQALEDKITEAWERFEIER